MALVSRVVIYILYDSISRILHIALFALPTVEQHLILLSLPAPGLCI